VQELIRARSSVATHAIKRFAPIFVVELNPVDLERLQRHLRARWTRLTNTKKPANVFSTWRA